MKNTWNPQDSINMLLQAGYAALRGCGQNWFREQRAEERGRVWLLLFFDSEEAYKTSRCEHMKHTKQSFYFS
jgi:hypothetical protein